ncbi:MAG: hypothetical protein HC863_02370, partial [Myxococcales bacterium]|nr:hypothetical protein [Myxococcales bacterium]
MVELLVRLSPRLLLAVRPWQLDEVGPVFARLGEAGVYVALWPMLDDSHGRWASVASQPGFIALVDEVLTRAPGCAEIIVDLERVASG